MSDPRHFTIVDDWVALNPDVSATEYRIYSIIKGNIFHIRDGIPETGFRATAAWVSKVSGGMFAVSTVHKALQSLASKGVLRRLNDPQQHGEGADFEFVFDPLESYEGPRSIMAEAAKLLEKKSRSVSFDPIDLGRGPKRGAKKRVEKMPNMGMDDPTVEEEPLSPDEAPDDDDPEFDLSGLDRLPRPGRPMPSTAEAEFAAELEEATSGNTVKTLRLMAGSCARIAKAYGPALEAGWQPRELALRLAAELNPQVRMPEKLLISKVRDLGKPPKRAVEIPREAKAEEPLDGYVPPKQFHQRNGIDLPPEEQDQIDSRLREYQARRNRARLLKP